MMDAAIKYELGILQVEEASMFNVAVFRKFVVQ
jgi:hypothetical protein